MIPNILNTTIAKKLHGERFERLKIRICYIKELQYVIFIEKWHTGLPLLSKFFEIHWSSVLNILVNWQRLNFHFIVECAIGYSRPIQFFKTCRCKMYVEQPNNDQASFTFNTLSAIFSIPQTIILSIRMVIKRRSAVPSNKNAKSTIS